MTGSSNESSEDSYLFERLELEKLQLTPVGGRLRFRWRAWRRIGASKRVCRWLRGVYRLPFLPQGEQQARLLFSSSCPPALALFYNNAEKHRAILELLQQLLKKAVIKCVEPGDACLHNVVFHQPKPNGT